MQELFNAAEEIFGFLDIPQRKEDYLRRKLYSAIQLGYITSTTQVHSEIANWVDIITTSWIEKTFERLDAPVIGSESKGKPRYPQSAVTRETPLDLLMRSEGLKDDITVGEALEVLHPSLPATHSKMLELLTGERTLDINSGMTESEVKQNADKLIDRLEQITARLYEREILVPRITLVKFDPYLQIVYKGRLTPELVQVILDAHNDRVSANRVGRRYETTVMTGSVENKTHK